ncbi:MAG: holo-ACP synthase [Alphaproteobacteria bacterium]|nr:holo-ACP synthase [Alphaproteobacteria bacterium]
MILGIGSDIIDIRRIEKILDRYGQRFIQRVFTLEEQQKAAKRTNPAATYAKRFAAKEACAKALGTGVNHRVFFRDLGVVNLASGKPIMKLTGGALDILNKITPSGMKAVINLTITDEMPLAQAMVIIEAEPTTN